MKNYTNYFIIILITINSCFEYKKLKVNITSTLETNEIPSGSGIVNYNKKYFIIGDDSPWLYTFKKDKIEKINLISNHSGGIKNRVNKKQKLDFEDIEIVKFNKENYLFVISSGTHKHYRDTLFVLDANYTKKIFFRKNLRNLYNAMQNEARLKSINIEGLTSDNDMLYFAHRGNHDRNVIFKINKKIFFYYLQSENEYVPKLKVLYLDLKINNKMKAGLSSLQYIKELNSLLFTASIEGTKNSYDDGKIGESYIGIFPIKDPKNIKMTPLKKDNNIILTKLEGITVSEIDIINHRIKVIAISDNDNGKTGIFKIDIKY